MSLEIQLNFLFLGSTDSVLQLQIRMLIIFFNTKGTFFKKMQQIQFATRVGKNRKQKQTKKKNTRKKKQKIFA